jgi:drug/metabolite transporter (DMT)-like permease
VTNETSSRVAASRATLLIVLSAFGFGAIAIFITIAIRAGAPLLSILSWRYVIGALVLGAIALFQGVRLGRSGTSVLLLGGIGQSIIAVLTLSALEFIPAATLAFLFYTYPAWVAIIARVRHSEPLSPPRLFALLLSLAGIFVMVGAPGGATLHPVGVGLALVGALLYAIYIPLIEALGKNLPPVATAMYMSAGAAVVLTVLAAAKGELTADLHMTAWRAILGLSLVSTVGAFLMFLNGLRVLGPVRTAIISTVEPFFTALLGAWVLSQPLTRTTLAGGLLIATAVVILQLRSK